MFLSLEYLLALAIIVTVHEWAHALAALRLGDPTAEREGRVSLNPLRHLDFFGTLSLFLFGFGWGKPVPMDSRNFVHPVRDEALTAGAGLMANLFLAILAAIPMQYLPETGFTWIRDFFSALMELSLVLFVFNLLPFPPMDGSHFIRLFLPKRLGERAEIFMRKSLPYCILFILADLYLLPRILGFSLIWTAVSNFTYWVKAAILLLV